MYASLEQRMARGLPDQFPPFLPDESVPVNAEEQKSFYLQIKRIYELALVKKPSAGEWIG